jgi:predicted nucleotidyltransferase
MKEITKYEMQIMIRLFKDIGVWYNANNLSKEIGISSMGALKILKRLNDQDILNHKEEGRRKYYYLNYNNQFTIDFIEFLLKKEAKDSLPRIRRWITEIKNIDVDIAIIFGSVLRTVTHKDIDVMLVYKQNKKIDNIITEKNKLNVKRIHPIKQTISDLKNNIKKRDKLVLNAVKFGVVAKGQKKLIEVIKSVNY